METNNNKMKLKSFKSNNPNHNPFNEFISDEQFKYMIEQGFELGTLDSYGDIKGNIVYTKSMTSKYDWPINMYITENGISIDHDYSSGGNFDTRTYWFTKNPTVIPQREIEGSYEGRDMGAKYEDIEIYGVFTFEDAWNEMIDLANSW